MRTWVAPEIALASTVPVAFTDDPNPKLEQLPVKAVPSWMLASITDSETDGVKNDGGGQT